MSSSAHQIPGVTTVPTVSVIIPVRNGRDYIHEALDSVISQSFTDLEVCVIDDGSNDYDYSQLEALDSRIQVRRLQGDGVSRARNVGLKLARGRYIAFLDADDIWFPGKVLAQVRYFEEHPEVGVVFGEGIQWEQDANGRFPSSDLLIGDCSELVAIDRERSGWLYTRLLMGLLVGMNTAVIRRELNNQLGGFDESMQIGEDYEYWLRASRITQMHALAGPLALYRIHNASAMHRHRVDAINHLATLLDEARGRWGLANPDGTCISEANFCFRLAATQFSHGYAHYWHGDPVVAKESFSRAFWNGFRPVRSLAYMVLASIKSATRS